MPSSLEQLHCCETKERGGGREPEDLGLSVSKSLSWGRLSSLSEPWFSHLKVEKSSLSPGMGVRINNKCHC